MIHYITCEVCLFAAGWVSWVPATGQDSVADHASPDIDFLAFHSWIDNWEPGVSHAPITVHKPFLLKSGSETTHSILAQTFGSLLARYCVFNIDMEWKLHGTTHLMAQTSDVHGPAGLTSC